jgi:hypothetical protein
VKLKRTTEPARKKMRLYELDGHEAPSVTTVISGIESDSWLDAWRRKIGREAAEQIRADSAAFGTRVHALISGSEVDRVSELERTCAQAGLDWLYKNVDEVLAFELKMIDHDLGFGGTVDVIARMNHGALAVIDWKTSKRLSPAHNLQTAGYAMLAREAGYDVDERYVVRLWKDEQAGRVSTRKCNNDRDFDAFKAAVVIWHWRHPGISKNGT